MNIISQNQLPTGNKAQQHAALINQINGLDLSPIKYKLALNKNWSSEKMNSVEIHYKAFLFFNALFPDEINVPTLDVDEMWHTHILDTMKYMTDCANILGYYLHHFPYLGDRSKEDEQVQHQSFNATIDRYVDYFGFNPLEDTNTEKKLGGCGGGCGSSCSSSCSSSDPTPSDPTPSSCTVPIIPPSEPTPTRKKEKPKRPSNNIGRKVPKFKMDAWDKSVSPEHLNSENILRPDYLADADILLN